MDATRSGAVVGTWLRPPRAEASERTRTSIEGRRTTPG